MACRCLAIARSLSSKATPTARLTASGQISRHGAGLRVHHFPHCAPVAFLPRAGTGSKLPVSMSIVQTRQQSSDPAKKRPEEEEEADEGPNWKVIVGFGLFAASLGAFLNIRHYERTRRQQEEADRNREANVGVGGQSITGQSVGRPDIGGDFMLIDQDGKLTKNTDFKGQWMFLYFGFTYCPDICPNELMRMVEVLDALDKDKATEKKLLPVFVTIDPERDGPSQLKDYLSDWHPRLIGLTGSPDQIKDVSSKYRVYYSKARMGVNPDEYLIDHSVMFYLVDPAGRFTEYYGQNATPEEMTRKIADHIKSFRP